MTLIKMTNTTRLALCGEINKFDRTVIKREKLYEHGFKHWEKIALRSRDLVVTFTCL